MHHNFLFDLDQAFKAYNKSLWLELEKGTMLATQHLLLKSYMTFSKSGRKDNRVRNNYRSKDDDIL